LPATIRRVEHRGRLPEERRPAGADGGFLAPDFVTANQLRPFTLQSAALVGRRQDGGNAGEELNLPIVVSARRRVVGREHAERPDSPDTHRHAAACAASAEPGRQAESRPCVGVFDDDRLAREQRVADLRVDVRIDRDAFGDRRVPSAMAATTSVRSLSGSSSRAP
jgi:hypothetical protein